jgi:hypothetical protein
LANILTVEVFIGNKVQDIGLDEADMDAEPEALVEDVIKALKQVGLLPQDA